MSSPPNGPRLSCGHLAARALSYVPYTRSGRQLHALVRRRIHGG